MSDTFRRGLSSMTGGATNREERFAAGDAVRFHSVLRLVARQQQVDVIDSAVSATVHLGQLGSGGSGLAVELDVALPRASRIEAESALAAAQQVCPYSNATRGDIAVRLSMVEPAA